MAMGDRVGFKKGGSVSAPSATKPLKSGIKNSPLEGVKRANGIPGMKKGGRC
jgi:hypothetical protein